MNYLYFNIKGCFISQAGPSAIVETFRILRSSVTFANLLQVSKSNLIKFDNNILALPSNPPIPPFLGLAKNRRYSENGSIGSHVKLIKTLFGT